MTATTTDPRKGSMPATDPRPPDSPEPVPPQPPISDPPPSEMGDLHDPVEPQPVD